ncbi:MAG: hypothetical protein IJC50_08515 [Clostridia bacterium]|nr:hypothetical protein [Clostridia bacterium]
MDGRNLPPIDENGLNPQPTKPEAPEGKVSPSVKGENKQRRLFKKKRGGIVLTREEVKEIKAGRKKLRKQLRANGIKSRKEFELTASGLGLYFDKSKPFALLLWFFHGRWLWALLGAAAALLAALFAMSIISQMQGHFTINLSGGMLNQGFSLSETVGFENPTMRLFAEPIEHAPCISIIDIEKEIMETDGNYGSPYYFAYTFYIRNDGDLTEGYTWSCNLTSESQSLSEAAWVMIIEDNSMKFYAKPNAEKKQEALPEFNDNSRGYLRLPLEEFAANPDEQFRLIPTDGQAEYYRIVPYNFFSETIVAKGSLEHVEPQEVHKYTVVLWLEGDDPQCTNDLIGGHLGVEMQFKLIEEEDDDSEDGKQNSSWKEFWKWENFWDHLRFWEN